MKTINLDKIKEKLNDVFQKSDDSHEFLPIVSARGKVIPDGETKRPTLNTF